MNDRTLPTDDKTAIGADEREDWAYPSFAASGHVEIELPTLPGSFNSVERLHVRDFGRHVAGAVERSLRANPYKSGPQQSPAEVLAHYAAAARGAKLLDEDTLDFMSGLVRGFAIQKGESRQTYLEKTLRPFLNSLKPERRKK